MTKLARKFIIELKNVKTSTLLFIFGDNMSIYGEILLYLQ